MSISPSRLLDSAIFQAAMLSGARAVAAATITPPASATATLAPMNLTGCISFLLRCCRRA
jgi:hypothetical protein